jgi:hypothetical protein
MWTVSKTSIYFRHCEFQGAGEDQASEQHIFRIWDTHDFLVQYCYLHDIETTIFQVYNSCSNFTLEYSVLARRHMGTANHGEHMMLSGFDNPAAITIRHNIMYDCYGSGMVYFDNSNHPGGAEIYGNVFYQTSNRYVTSNGMVGGGSSYTYHNIKVYNNTFVNAYGLGGSPNNPAIYLPGTGSEAKNNVCYNTGGISIGSGTKSYNFYNNASYASGDAGGTGQNWILGTILFQDYANRNFRLQRETNAGTNLAPPFNQDMDGNIRGQGGIWDRGAYEYVSGANPSPNPPANVTIIGN